eukprot:2647538-Alexandrium_andersonii.AAC.1
MVELALVAAGIATTRWQEVPLCLAYLHGLVSRGTCGGWKAQLLDAIRAGAGRLATLTRAPPDEAWVRSFMGWLESSLSLIHISEPTRLALI